MLQLLAGGAAAVVLLGLFAWLAFQQQRLADHQEALNTTIASQQTQIEDLVTAQRDRRAAAAGGISVPSDTADENPTTPPELAEDSDPDVFGLGLLQLALDAIARRDDARQRALVAFIANLPEHPFRSQMLGLMRDQASDPLAAKQAAETLDGPVVEDPAPTGEATRLRFGLVEPGQMDGWDYDVLVCRTALERHDPYLESEVDRLLDSLRQADPQHGRIRLAPLGGKILQRDPGLAEPGLHLLVDGRRVIEARKGTQIAKRLAFDGYDFRLRGALGSATPWQITLVYCPE